MSKFLLILGLVFELGGIGVAIWGLADVRGEFFENLEFPHRAVFRRLADLVPVGLKRAFGWRPTTHYAEIHGAAHSTGSAEVRVRPIKGRPADDAPLAVWNRYWESRFDNLQGNLDGLAEDMRKADAWNAERIAEVTQRVETEIPRLQERLRDSVGGKGGKGLIRTWYALAAIGLGGFLQIIGVLIG